MKLHVKLMTIVAITVLFASCKDSNTLGKHIPATASIAVHINGKSLSEKLPWNDIKANPLFENVYTDSSISATVKKILDNPDNSGIDTKGDLIFFMQKDADGGYVVLQGAVKDAAAFKTLTAEMVENGTASEKDGISFVNNSSQCVGWNKEQFVLVADAPELGQMDDLSRRMKRDSIDISTNKKRDVVTACKAVFDLEEGQSLAKNEKFGKLVSEQGDLHFWINAEEMNKNGGSMPALAMVNLEKLYKGSFTAGTVNFDNGKINLSLKSYAGEEMSKLYEKYSGSKVSEEMLKKIPGKDVMGAVALNFKPEGLKEFLKLTNLDGFVNMGSAELGFTLDDFVKANKGDIVLGMSDLAMAADSTGSGNPKPGFNYVFASSIGDKTAFNKLVKAGEMLSGKFIEPGKAPFAYSTNGSLFAISNTQDNADKFINGPGSSFDFISKIAGEPMGGYFNIQAIMKAFGTEASKDSLGKMVYDASLKMWDNVVFKGGEFKDGAMISNGEINLMDKGTNSLKQLNGYFAVIGQVMKEKEKKQKEDMMALEDALKNGTLGDVPVTDEAVKAK
jgi:hypothetical protein